MYIEQKSSLLLNPESHTWGKRGGKTGERGARQRRKGLKNFLGKMKDPLSSELDGKESTVGREEGRHQRGGRGG